MTTTVPVTQRIGMNGSPSIGQNQYQADGQAVATATAGVSKGGMRGVGLLAVAIAEYALKKKATDLAKDYYNINKQDYQFNVAIHQQPMSDSAREAMSPTDNPTYTYDPFASIPGGVAKSSIIDKQWFEARRRISKYNIGQQRRLDYDMALAKTHAVVSGWNMGTRYEQVWAEEHNNRAFDKKVAVANIGIGVGNIVSQGMAHAVSGLASSYDAIGDTVASIGNGLAKYSGEAVGRENTRRAFNRASDTAKDN